MTDTPIAILQKAANLGLRVGLKPPDTLTVESAKPWSKDFAETLRDYKKRLIATLKLPFVMAYSRTLEETIFLCEDEDTKAALIEAGAESFSIYTCEELRILVQHNRAKPFIPDELLRLHAAKRAFNPRIAN